jgi:hypothetical protein
LGTNYERVFLASPIEKSYPIQEPMTAEQESLLACFEDACLLLYSRVAELGPAEELPGPSAAKYHEELDIAYSSMAETMRRDHGLVPAPNLRNVMHWVLMNGDGSVFDYVARIEHNGKTDASYVERTGRDPECIASNVRHYATSVLNRLDPAKSDCVRLEEDGESRLERYPASVSA